MKSNTMHHLFPLLQLTIRTLHKLHLRPHSIKIPRARKRSPKLCNLPRSLINCNHITTRHFLLPNRLNHLRPQIINRLHLRRLQRQLPRLRRSSSHRRTINLNLNNLTFNHLRFLLNSHTNRLTKSLRQSFGFRHLKREKLTTSNHGERSLKTEGFRHSHCNSGFASTWLTGEKNSASSDFTVFNHLKNDAGGFASGDLADHAFRDGAWL
ncbi:hypothetical protein MtrunA17_Chr3g0103461 [Medicago truncatula]|uniref:Uncharacterized protein n=1 Tax=Medicago truncatula TaxID=3880 RepID=A0A396IPC0_MEDTR|nr:hypothetical protein MtrunA17_Chr3g0103461 [Medicago truncatula]